MNMIINEGSIKLKIYKAEKISRGMSVFYNPAMGLNRDISILLLHSINKNNMQIADPLAATGVRSLRFLRELHMDKIKKIYINDYKKDAIRQIKQNLVLNKINYKNNNKIKIFNKDANLFMLNSTGFDYIDLDPFGSPNDFMDSACKRLARHGILAVTNTDTSALCGTAPNACIRKYWSIPKRGPIMHETGLRILIRKLQLIAAQYDKALLPIFSYSKDHYMRIFLRNEKGKNKVNKLLKQHNYFNDAGPMWLGSLWDKKLVERMHKIALANGILNKDKELIKFLQAIKHESKINTIGFYDLHYLCKKYKIKVLRKKSEIIEKVKKFGYHASETHFKGEGIRSNMPHKEFISLIRD